VLEERHELRDNGTRFEYARLEKSWQLTWSLEHGASTARSGEEVMQRQRRSKLYGMGEYLMVWHGLQYVHLADQARKARAEPGGRRGVIRQEERIPEIKASFGPETLYVAVSKGATQ
jgi:hypothetical protein